MTVLCVGIAWSVAVGILLRRTVRHGAAHRATTLDLRPAGSGPPRVGPGIGPRIGPRIGVVIPARNEEANIAACLRSVSEQDYPWHLLSILVVDDGSGDDTAALARGQAGADGRIAVMDAGALPEGWFGKSHACWRGAGHLDVDWLCFLDADVQAAPRLLTLAVTAARAANLDMLSLQPFQVLGSFWEQLIIPAGMLMIACGKAAPPALATRTSGLAVNGQFLLVRMSAYRLLGGHAAVRSEVCEDTALARRFHAAGCRVAVMAADHLLRTRMYRDLPSIWQGFSKNAVDILGSTARTALVVGLALAVGAATLGVPALAGFVAWDTRSTRDVAGLVVAAAGSGVVVGVHAAALRHFKASMLLALLFPVAVWTACLVALNSIRLRCLGRVTWRARRYALSGARDHLTTAPPATGAPSRIGARSAPST